MTFVFVEKLDH